MAKELSSRRHKRFHAKNVIKLHASFSKHIYFEAGYTNRQANNLVELEINMYNLIH